jgi:hypothetical protein
MVVNIYACNLNKEQSGKRVADKIPTKQLSFFAALIDLDNVGSANCAILPQTARMRPKSWPGRCGERKIS